MNNLNICIANAHGFCLWIYVRRCWFMFDLRTFFLCQLRELIQKSNRQFSQTSQLMFNKIKTNIRILEYTVLIKTMHVGIFGVQMFRRCSELKQIAYHNNRLL